LRKCEDLGVRAGFLRAELITGKAKDLQRQTGKFFVQCTQTCVLAGEASLTRKIDYE
jgi:hypothetical protein